MFFSLVGPRSNRDPDTFLGLLVLFVVLSQQLLQVAVVSWRRWR